VYRKPVLVTWKAFRERVGAGIRKVLSEKRQQQDDRRPYLVRLDLDGTDKGHKMSVAKWILREYAGRTVR